MDVYLDIVFLYGFIINLIVANIASKILKIKTNIKKLILFSIFLSICSIVSIFEIGQNILGIIFNITAFYIGIILLYYNRGLVENIRRLGVFVGVDFLFGTASLCIIKLAKLEFINIGNTAYIVCSDLIFIISLICVYVPVRLILFFISQKKLLYRVRITINPYIVETTGLVDTGNLLRNDSKNPVIFIEKSLFPDIHPSEKTINCSTVRDRTVAMDLYDIDELYLIDEDTSFNNLSACLVDRKLSENNSFRVLLHSSLL